MEPHKELREAVKLIEKHGWCRYQPFDPRTGAMLSGACAKARCGDIDAGPSDEAFVVLRSLFDRAPWWINDYVLDSKEEAIAYLNLGADLATPTTYKEKK